MIEIKVDGVGDFNIADISYDQKLELGKLSAKYAQDEEKLYILMEHIRKISGLKKEELNFPLMDIQKVLTTVYQTYLGENPKG